MLEFHHTGLMDQDALIDARNIPLVVYHPPRLIDTRFSTDFNLMERRDAKQSGRWFVFLNRRVRPSSLLKEKLSDYQIEYYKKRDDEVPLGTEWYSVQTYPSDGNEWDIDTFLVAECDTRDQMIAFRDVYLGPGAKLSFSQVISYG